MFVGFVPGELAAGEGLDLSWIYNAHPHAGGMQQLRNLRPIVSGCFQAGMDLPGRRVSEPLEKFRDPLAGIVKNAIFSSLEWRAAHNIKLGLGDINPQDFRRCHAEPPI